MVPGMLGMHTDLSYQADIVTLDSSLVLLELVVVVVVVAVLKIIYL